MQALLSRHDSIEQALQLAAAEADQAIAALDKLPASELVAALASAAAPILVCRRPAELAEHSSSTAAFQALSRRSGDNGASCSQRSSWAISKARWPV